MSPARRARMFLEMGAIYGLGPLLVFALAQWTQLPLLIFIIPIVLLVILALTADESFSWRSLLGAAPTRSQLIQVILLFALLGASMIVFVYAWLPESFLLFPRQRPGIWFAIMLLYPLISVTAQEIMFRVFFLHRYGDLFVGNLPRAVFVNAALFAFAHVIFASWIAITMSFAGGLIFAYRFFSTRSFWAVMLEHSLYGNLIFTLGLGRHLLAGVPLA